MAIFFNFPPTSNHLHPLQVENCGSNSLLVVDEGLKRLRTKKKLKTATEMIVNLTREPPNYLKLRLADAIHNFK